MKNNIMKFGFLILALWAFVGCATMNGPYGSITPDQAVEKNFEAFILDPGMNYYYSGPDIYPNALIGLKKAYVLDNDFWKPVEPNPKTFRHMIENMKYKAQSHGTAEHGFVMKDPQGNPIGVWYSILSIKTMVVKMGPDNKVMVYTPELVIYPEDIKHGGDGGGKK
jgi:hypothetical protein